RSKLATRRMANGASPLAGMGPAFSGAAVSGAAQRAPADARVSSTASASMAGRAERFVIAACLRDRPIGIHRSFIVAGCAAIKRCAGVYTDWIARHPALIPFNLPVSNDDDFPVEFPRLPRYP